MRLIFCILSLVIFAFLPAGAVKKIEANPINIAVILTQETDTAKIASSLNYYGYLRQSLQEGYTIFIHPNGSTIRYKLSDQKSPIVEVSSKTSAKERDQILKNLNFQKQGDTYERKSIGYTTKCTSGSHGYLVLTRQSKSKE